MPKRILPLIPRQLIVEEVIVETERIVINCRSRLSAPRCPSCRRVSSRMHSRYKRRIADLPWQGCPVVLCVHVRRLRCANRRCEQRIFAERAEDVAARHARRTLRVRDVQRSVGLALGGEAGARLIERLPAFEDTAARHDRPCDPRHLVSDGDRGDARRLSGEQSDKARIDRTGFLLGASDQRLWMAPALQA